MLNSCKPLMIASYMYVIYSMQRTPMDSPSGTPSAKQKSLAKLSGQFDHNVTPKPSTAQNSEPAKVNTYILASYVCILYI